MGQWDNSEAAGAGDRLGTTQLKSSSEALLFRLHFIFQLKKKIILTKAESSSSLPSSVITKLTHSTEAPAQPAVINGQELLAAEPAPLLFNLNQAQLSGHLRTHPHRPPPRPAT